jgi:predicted transcriptional regulator
MDSIEQTMYWLLAGSKGSLNRIRILQTLERKPMNLNELSKATGMNYKTAQHHIELLLENNLLIAKGNKYGQVYFISDLLKSKNELFTTFTQSIQSASETQEEEK